jgi:hypothetical protein
MQIKIVVTQDRLNKYASVDEFIEIQKGNLETIKLVAARFAIDDKSGEYYPVREVETEFGTDYFADEKPIKIIGKMNLEELMTLKNAFSKKVKDEAIPPPNGKATAEQE